MEGQEIDTLAAPAETPENDQQSISDEVTFSDYVNVDTSEDCEEKEPEQKVQTDELEKPKEEIYEEEPVSFVTGDSSLASKLKRSISEYEINHVEEAKYAIGRFYENIESKVCVKYEKTDEWHVFFSSGKHGTIMNGAATNERVWKSMQNPAIRDIAIKLCAKEGVVLHLGYRDERREWSWQMQIPV